MRAPTPRPSKPRLLVAQTDEYNDDLSEGLSVINNTTDLSEGLPIINDTIDLSKGLPVINNTKKKMTYVVVLLVNVLMICVVYDLCGGRPVWPMTCVVNNLYGQ